jgi:histidine phosphotransferase ChpT
MTQPPDLAALVGSRICHDLVSPLGAISNAVELLAMDGATQSPEMTLIAESVAAANARIRFFRLAFGGAGGDARIARTEVQQILAAATRGERVTVDWHSAPDLARREVKLAFLLLQCLMTALPWGGAISVTQSGQDWTIAARSPRMKLDPGLWDNLAKAPTGPVSAAQVQFALAAQVLVEQSRALHQKHDAAGMTLTF